MRLKDAYSYTKLMVHLFDVRDFPGRNRTLNQITHSCRGML